MNLVRSIAAVVGTLGVALAAGSLFQQAGPGTPPGQSGVDTAPAATASLASGLSGTVPRAAPDPVTDATDGPVMPGVMDLPAAAPAAGGALDGDLSDAALPAATAEPAPALTGPLALATDTPSMPDIPPADAAPVAADAAVPDPLMMAEPDPCAIWLVVTPADGAMLETSVYAPCHAAQRAEFDHAGLRFSTRLGSEGQAELMIPALRADARVTITLADGSRAEDGTAVPDMAGYDRLVLGWTGLDALTLHAFADGAGFGAEGHIHPAFTGAPGHAPYGFLTLLGDTTLADPALTQVYTFPADTRAVAGRVVIEVEAAITADTCGTEIAARTLLSHGGEAGATRRVTVSLPACDGIDGFLTIDGLIGPVPEGMAQAG